MYKIRSYIPVYASNHLGRESILDLPEACSGMFKEAVNHVAETWDHVLNGQSTLGEKVECGVELTAGLLAGAALTKFGITRFAGREAGAAERLLPDLRLSGERLERTLAAWPELATGTRTAITADIDYFAVGGKELTSHFLVHNPSGALIQMTPGCNRITGATDVLGNSWRELWTDRAAHFQGMELRPAGASEWQAVEAWSGRRGTSGYSGARGLTDGFGELWHTSWPSNGSYTNRFHALDGKIYEESAQSFNDGLPHVMDAYRQLFGDARSVVISMGR